jgi:hypothetical protein
MNVKECCSPQKKEIDRSKYKLVATMEDVLLNLSYKSIRIYAIIVVNMDIYFVIARIL